MKNIILDKLILTNFKGVRTATIDFTHRTTISGENGTGKTTLFDAFFWLLFDKNSENKSQFEIKTLDKNNNTIHNLEHNVTGQFRINEVPLTLSKTYKEKWTRKRGQKEQELTGHETIYEINGVDVLATEYKKRITELVDEKVFMLITNPLQFSQAQGWKERREVLMKILGEVNDEDVIKSNPEELSPLSEKFKTRTFEDLQRITKATKGKLNDELKFIPERIKEVELSKIDPIPVERLNEEKKLFESQIENLEQGMKLNTARVSQKANYKKQQYDLLIKQGALKTRLFEESDKQVDRWRKELKEANSELELKNINIDTLTGSISGWERRLKQVEGEIENLLNSWKNQKSVEFEVHENNFTCPTCLRPYDEEHIAHTTESLEADFNRKKSEVLQKIKMQGDDLRTEQEGLLAKIPEGEAKLIELQEGRDMIQDVIGQLRDKIAEINSKRASEEDDPEWTELQHQIDDIQGKIESLDMSDDTYFTDEIKRLKSKIFEIDSELAKATWNDKANERIKELEKDLRDKSELFNEAESTEFMLEEFLKAKVKLLESKINERFSKVQFKLFNTLVNGGINETCEALIDGVPFADANKASKLNAGLDIINTLNDYYETLAPIWIDNRESVNEVIDTKAQLINLVVSKENKLTVKEEI